MLPINLVSRISFFKHTQKSQKRVCSSPDYRLQHMKYLFYLILLPYFLLLSKGYGDALTTDPPLIWPVDCIPCGPPIVCLPTFPLDTCEDVNINLRNPLYLDGTISTTEGGVLTSKELRIQAMHISYTKNLEGENPQFRICCKGRLLIEYKKYLLVGESFEYDFINRCGKIICGKTAFFPWFIAGDEILLLPNGEIVIHNGAITTSECGENDVVIAAKKIVLDQDLLVTATGISFQIREVTLFGLPKIKVDLDTTYEAPVAFNFGWNGYLGTHAGIRYHFLTFGDFKGYLRADGYLGRGIGLGIETEYDPLCDPAEFYTRSYFAHDLSIDDPEKRDRYRIEGSYFDRFWNEHTDLHVLYDFVSDAQFAQDYENDDFALNPAGRTELSLHTQEERWMANLYTLVRVNSFQTINEELPTVEFGLHPFELFETKLIFENLARLSYLDYSFSKDVFEAMSFRSGRFEVQPKVYRPIALGAGKITPSATFIGIAYSNSPSGGSVGQAVGDLAVDAQVPLSRSFGCLKHVATPYIDYHFLTHPRSSLPNHFLFTIDDAYDYLNIMRFGLRNNFFVFADCVVAFPLMVDLWTNAFFDTQTVPQTIPKGYLDCELQIHPRLFLWLNTAVDFQHKNIDYINTRVAWTISENVAVSSEWRHRSRFYYRKADFYNFLLESVRSQEALLASPLSEKRDTFLLKAFYRLNPDWAARFELRHGWHREFQPNYIEYHAQLESVVFQHWRVLFSYEKRTEDHRYSIALKLAGGAP